MYYYSIFQQLFKIVPRYRFEKSVEKHSGDRYCKHFTAIRHHGEKVGKSDCFS